MRARSVLLVGSYLLLLTACKESKAPGTEGGWRMTPNPPPSTVPGPAAGPAPMAATGGAPAAATGGAPAAGTGGMAAGTGGMAAGTGGTGTGGAMGTGGMTGTGGATAGSGATMPMAVATIAGFMGGTVTGTATFVQNGTDVTVNVSLMNCPDGVHPVHIHQGTSCMDATMQGAHWDTTRGEGIPNVMCTGGTGTAMVTRMATPPTTAWSVGGDAATNVIGHAFVVHNEGDPAPRIGCGLIMMQ